MTEQAKIERCALCGFRIAVVTERNAAGRVVASKRCRDPRAQLGSLCMWCSKIRGGHEQPEPYTPGGGKS
jgi:hypothetical protein